MEENRIPKKVLSMNLETTRLRSRPRNRWQDGVTKDGRLVGGTGWRERVHNREEWETLPRVARNCHILHMPLNECILVVANLCNFIMPIQVRSLGPEVISPVICIFIFLTGCVNNYIQENKRTQVNCFGQPKFHVFLTIYNLTVL